MHARKEHMGSVGFHDRYANDPEFKQQVDEGRKRAKAVGELKALKDALAATQGQFGKRGKMY